MRTPSIRTLAAIAYERGEEFDPALMLSPTLAEQLDVAGTVGMTLGAPASPVKRSDRHELARYRAHAQSVPSWFEASDLVSGPLDARAGELLSELAC